MSGIYLWKHDIYISVLSSHNRWLTMYSYLFPDKFHFFFLPVRHAAWPQCFLSLFSLQFHGRFRWKDSIEVPFSAIHTDIFSNPSAQSVYCSLRPEKIFSSHSNFHKNVLNTGLSPPYYDSRTDCVPSSYIQSSFPGRFFLLPGMQEYRKSNHLHNHSIYKM